MLSSPELNPVPKSHGDIRDSFHPDYMRQSEKPGPKETKQKTKNESKTEEQKEANISIDFNKTLQAVLAGEKIDSQAESILKENEASILKLAGVNGDVNRNAYQTMEEAMDAYKAFDAHVEKTVQASGYKDIVADGFRQSLLEERQRIFREAFQEVSKPNALRNLENAVKGRMLADASNQFAALRETVGSPERFVKSADIQEKISKLETLADQREANALDRSIQEDVAQWVAEELRDVPNASTQDLLRQLKTMGANEFINENDIEAIRSGEQVKNLFVSTGKTESGFKSLERTNARIKELSQLENAPQAPEGAAEDWEVSTTDMTTTYPGRRTIVPLVQTNTKTRTKPGVMQRLASGGRRLMYGLALLVGIKAGTDTFKPVTSEDLPPHRETAEETVPGKVEAQTDEVEIIQKLSDLNKGEKVEVRYEKGDPRNLDRALAVLNQPELPSKTEFLKMKRDEQVKEMESALSDFQVLREVLSEKSEAVDASKTADLKQRLQQRAEFMNLLNDIREQ